jgi:hypothetical protein
MGTSDVGDQKKSKTEREVVEGHREATEDATPDFQPPGTTKKLRKKDLSGKKTKRRASSRGNRSRQH